MAHHYPKLQYGGFAPVVIKFPYPPTEGAKREVRDYNRRVTESLSGVRQVQTNFTEATRAVKFRFLTEEDIERLEIFVDNHASKGKTFKYFEDQESDDFFIYELDQNTFEPKPHNSVGPNSYLYELELKFRRVLNVNKVDGFMRTTIENGAGPIEIDGLVFDSASYRSAKVFYEIWRKTSLEERVNNGELTAIFQNGIWAIAPGNFVGDPPAGVSFEVDPVTGQLLYYSDAMAGADYASEMQLRNFTIIGG